MYRQFCKNLRNYLDINKSNNYRYRIGKEIEILADISLYNRLKEYKSIEYMKISNFLYQINNYKALDPAIKKLIWEMWAYGFEIQRFDNIDNQYADNTYAIEEKIKLIGLLLSTHYWN